MLQILLASIGFVPWVLYIIMTYYSKDFSQIDHIESATAGYGWYLLSIGVIYGIYKTLSLMQSGKYVRIWFWQIIGFAFLQLLTVALVYSAMQVTKGSPFFGPTGASGIVLFGHIIGLIVYPVFLAFLWRALGYSVLKWLKWWDSIPLRIRIGAEISIGLGIFATLMIAFGIFGMFTLTWLLVVLTVLVLIAIPGWIETYRDIQTRYIEFDQHSKTSGSLLDMINPKLLSVEFAFLIVSFLVSVSLINAIRPMPIGWDDLGVYMNFPRIMALSGSMLQWAGMYTWQVITGTWFLWDNIAATAFYVNQLGGILSMIAMTSVLSVIFEVKHRKYLLSLPLLFAGIYYMMPMTVFQQAKDMKLDPALMMVSVSAFGVLWYTLRAEIEKYRFYILLGLIGILVGIAFSIKFTTLILIVASLTLIAYRLIGIFGCIGFFFIFLAIFTGGDLWSKMNVWLPVENRSLIHSITIGCGMIWLLSMLISIYQYSIHHFKEWILASIVFVLGIAIGLSPWLIKNGYEARIFTSNQKSGLINSVLSGYGWWLDLNNYGAIYSLEEYTKKRKAQQASSITSEWKSQNEDFSRYFGQESWLNNYIKLPANLTFQKNQSGEFTDITYIFLAFFPAILLFLGGRKYPRLPGSQWYYFISVILGMICIYILSFLPAKVANTSILMWLYSLIGSITLPIGYGVLIAIMLVTVFIAHFCIEKSEVGSRIKDIFVMLMIYGFLFLISAFGIVWYGVFVYFLFLSIIGLAALTFVSYSSEDSEDIMWIKSTLSILFFLFILVYVIRSAFPHGWNNLVSAGMNEYKYNKLTQNESIFTYRADYITPIATMNTTDPQWLAKRAGSLAQSVAMQKILTPDRLASMTVADLHQVLLYFITQIESGKKLENQKLIAQDIEVIGRELYDTILSPKWADVNMKWIYRIGTFMTYLINQNAKRYLDDSLVFDFETFFYDPTPEITIDRMKKLWLGYLLTDLNAATIDRDPRRALTTRFEHLLLTMRAKNLTLIDTDNLCLRVAIDEYKSGRLKSDIEFIDIAGTNSESYRWIPLKPVYRSEKQTKCANYIVEILNNSSASGTTLPNYLVPLKTSLTNAKNQTEQQEAFSRAIGQSYFALFEIK